VNKTNHNVLLKKIVNMSHKAANYCSLGCSSFMLHKQSQLVGAVASEEVIITYHNK
jgi:uncharacterized protein YutD